MSNKLTKREILDLPEMVALRRRIQECSYSEATMLRNCPSPGSVAASNRHETTMPYQKGDSNSEYHVLFDEYHAMRKRLFIENGFKETE